MTEDTRTEQPVAGRRHRQEKVGVVTRTKMQKTIVVEVRRRVPQPALQENHHTQVQVLRA